MGWRESFHGRRRQQSMRSCMKRREPLVDCPPSRKVRERPLRALGRRCAGLCKARRLRGKRLKALSKRHETKSPLEHLIKTIEERMLMACRLRQAIKDKEYGWQFDSGGNRWEFRS